MKLANFPFDWIAPDEYRYCGCGMRLVPPGTTVCAHCRYRPKLDDFLCHCGKKAAMMDVFGFRCEEHSGLPSTLCGDFNPSQTKECYINSRMTMTLGRLRPNFVTEDKVVARTRSDADHAQLEAERNTLAEQRREDGVLPLFWMEISTKE